MRDYSKIMQCLSDPRLALPMALNFIQIIKPELKEMLQSFPSVIIIGVPGTGKSPMAKACLVDCTELNAFDSHGKVMKKYAEAENCVLIDDIAAYKARNQRQHVISNFESIIRKSYSGENSLALFTAENEALEQLLPSGIQRAIPVFIGDGIKDAVFSRELKHLQDSKELTELLNQFRAFWETSMYHGKVSQLLDTFREKYKQEAADTKRLNMVFSFYYVFLILNELLLREGVADTIPVDELVKEYLTVTFNGNSCESENKNWTERVFELALKTGMFRPQSSYVKKECDYYMKNGCRDKKLYDCQRDNDVCCLATTDCYPLETLVLQYGKITNSLLLMDTRYLYYGNRLPLHGSILIVDVNTLLDIMNNAAILMCKNSGEERELFTHQKLHSELYKNNRCMSIPNGNSSRYTMAYPATGIDEYNKIVNVRVVIIRLKPNEANDLQERNRNLGHFDFPYADDSSRIVYTLSQTFGGVQCRFGEIGRSSARIKTVLEI